MKASDWISAKDKLPKHKNNVFVCCAYNEEQWIELATYKKLDSLRREWYDVNNFRLFHVTHWQEIVFPNKIEKK